MSMIESLHSGMARTPQTVASLVSGVDGAALDWRPTVDAWSITDIVNHMYLEEVQDFRVRLKSVLADPAVGWPPIDPENAVLERRKEGHPVEETLAQFAAERAASVDWLGTVGEPDWKVSYPHPVLGDLSAGELLAAWAAHDHLHLRQLVQRRFQWVEEKTQPFSTAYAGTWPRTG